jgi:PII-like signaling protein
MESTGTSILKIYASSTDRINNTLLYEHVLNMAKDKGISGVTVFRGIMGYGRSSKISTSRFWELTEKLPIMIEMIDTTKNLETFFRLIERDLVKMPKGCVVIMEPATVLLQKPGHKDGTTPEDFLA